MPLSLRCCTTQSMAAMTWDTSVAPSAAATFMFRIRASGAMPDEVLGVVLVAGGHRRVAPGDDPGHVRAVAEAVQVAQVRRLALQRQVRPVDDLAGGGEPLDRGQRRCR